MKRCEVNQIIRDGEAFVQQHGFILPPFARWTPQDWENKGPEAREIAEHALGWDVTDFGLGQYDKKGVLLFTIRNGALENLRTMKGKTYCEKILICGVDQLVLHHYHKSKTEDIINRGGGDLEIVLHWADENGKFSDRDVTVSCDGVERTVPAGGKVILGPGESITLEPLVYHQFRALEKPVLVGEVSTVNDDANDNFFLEPVGRFPQIEEDEPPYRLLVTDYGRYYKHGAAPKAGY
ncbi:MAG: D-lyxose/D-mannose family sugar isomerase [Meiothermus sp.]